jgi:hypothetical protein
MEDSIKVIVGIFSPTRPRRVRRIAGLFVSFLSLIGWAIVGYIIVAVKWPQFDKLLQKLLVW